MYVVSKNAEPFSPHIMRFQNLWIYDLRPFHDFWKKSVLKSGIKSNSTISWDESAWGALLKIYKIHTFAPTQNLEAFADDYHSHFKNPVGRKSHEKFFSSLRRLGLQRVGHLQRLSFIEVGKRFGKAWADFFKGVLDPHRTPWPWEPFRKLEPLFWQEDLDDPSTDALFILSNLYRGLELLQSKTHQGIQRIEIILQHSEEEVIDLEFQHPILLQKDSNWIKRLFEERLTRLCLETSVTRLGLRIFPNFNTGHVQLSLFQKDSQNLNIQNLCRRLENQGFQVFKPLPSPSYVPESSWFRASPLSPEAPQSQHALFRPLIQFEPKKISAPEGVLKRTEQLDWYDERGVLHSRDYYVTRFPKHWGWVFKDENENWFQQGIIE